MSGLNQNCDNCKHGTLSINQEPCMSCLASGILKQTGWEPIIEPTCKWIMKYNEGKFLDWHSDCGQLIAISGIDPVDYNFNYCPYCAKRLVIEEVTQ